jgi:hypothetical protein
MAHYDYSADIEIDRTDRIRVVERAIGAPDSVRPATTWFDDHLVTSIHMVGNRAHRNFLHNGYYLPSRIEGGRMDDVLSATSDDTRIWTGAGNDTVWLTTMAKPPGESKSAESAVIRNWRGLDTIHMPWDMPIKASGDRFDVEYV